MRSRHLFAKALTAIAGAGALVLATAGLALAQAPPEITPNNSITPSKTVQPWIYQMAIGALILGGIVLLGLTVSYLRFSPKFFGREEGPRAPVPGQRPQLLTPRPPGQRPPMPTQVAPAPAAAVAPAAAPTATGGTATAVAERPASTQEPEGGDDGSAASTQTTAPPQAEPATQADGAGQAEVEAPEPPDAKAEAGAAKADPGQTATPQPAAHSGPAALDQETFDRVLAEQLDKGVDRRVAEGRARAAAVVAARKKAQG